MREDKAITAKDRIPKTEDMIVPYFLIKSKILFGGYVEGGGASPGLVGLGPRVGETARVRTGVGEACGEGDGVAKGEGVCLGVGVVFGDGDGLLGEAEGMIMGVGVGLAVGLGVGETCGETVELGVGAGVDVGVGVGVGVGSPPQVVQVWLKVV